LPDLFSARVFDGSAGAVEEPLVDRSESFDLAGDGVVSEIKRLIGTGTQPEANAIDDVVLDPVAGR
jgi:hypothetical protein